MRNSRFHKTQLRLELERPNPHSPVAAGAKGLIETLADLLLEALETTTQETVGGVDEHQDHA